MVILWSYHGHIMVILPSVLHLRPGPLCLQPRHSCHGPGPEVHVEGGLYAGGGRHAVLLQQRGELAGGGGVGAEVDNLEQ